MVQKNNPFFAQAAKTLITSGLAVALTLCSVSAWAASAALLGSIVGNVSLQSADGAQKTIKPYTHLQVGETLLLGDAAQVQLIYFKTAKEERWEGASQFRIGASTSEALSGSPKQVKQLPPVLAQQLKSLPDATEAKVRVGMVRLRAISSSKLAEVMTYYKEFRRQQPTDSALPEAFVVTTLLEADAPKELSEFLQEQLSQQPNNQALKQLAESLDLPK